MKYRKSSFFRSEDEIEKVAEDNEMFNFKEFEAILKSKL
jgi:hypothetical protein